MKIEHIWPELTTEKVIGRGAYGTVYKCFREVNGEKEYSAVKVISIPQNDEEYFSYNTEGLTVEQTKEYYKDIVDDFTSEIKILESLKGNKNVVEIRNYYVEENSESIGWNIYIEMELLTDFNSYSSDKTFTEEEVLKLGTDLCNALIVCNEKNIIHRDIKPENIFVSDTGDFKLGDFGVSRQMEKTYASMSRKGTFNYMAPEVFYSKKYDSRADVYSLGLVMYKLLNNNRMPFLDPEKQIIKYSERQAAFEKRINGEAIPHLKGVNSELNAVIMRACEYKAENRYSNAKEMQKALEKKKLSGASGLFYKYKKIFIAIAAVLAVAAVTVGIAGIVKHLPKNDDIVTTTAKSDESAEKKTEYVTFMVSGKEFTSQPVNNLYVFTNKNGVYLFNEKNEKTTSLYDKASVSPAFNGEEICFISDGNTAIYKTDTKATAPQKIFSSKEMKITSVLYCDKAQVIATCDGTLISVDAESGKYEKIADLGDGDYAVYANGCIVYLNNAKNGATGCDIYSYNIADKTSVKLASDAFAVENFAEKTYGVSAENSTQVKYLSKKNGLSQVKVTTCNLDGKGKQTNTKALDNFNNVVFWDSGRIFFSDGKDGISFYDFKSKTVTPAKVTADKIYSYDGKYYTFEKFSNAYRLNEILSDGTVKAARYTGKLTAEAIDAVAIGNDNFLMWDATAMNISTVKTTDIDPMLVEPTEKDWKEFEGGELYEFIWYLNYENYDRKNVDSKSFLFDYMLQYNGISIIYERYFDDYGKLYAEKPDPKNRFGIQAPDDYPTELKGVYTQLSAQKVEWLAENIFNIDYEFVEDLSVKDGEYVYNNIAKEPYYFDGYYYFASDFIYADGGGTGFDLRVKNKKYNVDGTATVNVDMVAGDLKKGSFEITVGVKEIEGKRYWSVYNLNVNASMEDLDDLSILEIQSQKQEQLAKPNVEKDKCSFLLDKSGKNIIGIEVSVYGTYSNVMDYGYYDLMDVLVEEESDINGERIINGICYSCDDTDVKTAEYIDYKEENNVYINRATGLKGLDVNDFIYNENTSSHYTVDLEDDKAVIKMYFDKIYPIDLYIKGHQTLCVDVFIYQGALSDWENDEMNHSNAFYLTFNEETYNDYI
ncbi:MAG: serine/threonine-protein kinase [Clostridia bacterium]|nr:serine/threonine-protein kinase [Clostridia bacterium]